ncbi:hypothetical protein [Holophaga foetida]|uniref:hypothetical protein n=1 Tax=Holophaga foetida TaxID=35839 RepID=UPI000247532C|nr:hypothetical protein [Holophaga foetida]
MTLNPQIALFAALLAALGGPTRAGSPEETEAGEFRKTQAGLHQLASERPCPDPDVSIPDYFHEIELIPHSTK